MKVLRTRLEGKTEKVKKISVERAVEELLSSHPKYSAEQIKKAVVKGVKLQGPQSSFYQLEAGFQGEKGEYKESASQKKRKKAGKVIKPETDETTITPEGLAEQCNSTAFNVRKAVRSLKLKRVGKYWAWNKVDDAETITNIIAAIKKAEEKPAPKPKKEEVAVESEIAQGPSLEDDGGEEDREEEEEEDE